MFDLKWIRDNPESFDRGLARRGLAGAAAELLALDRQWREAQTEAEQLQAERNRLAKEIGAAKAQGRDAADVLRRVAESKDRQAALETRAGALKSDLDRGLAALPNLPADEVPDGRDETHNRLIRQHGTPPGFAFPVRDHAAIGEGLRMMDFEAAGRLSGARFVVLSGALARLERALAQFMLDLHTSEYGYREVSPPLLVREQTVFGTGQLPKFGRGHVRHHQRPLAHSHRRGAAHQSLRRADRRRGGAAGAGHRLDAVLSRRGGCCRQGHARHDPPAPVLQGGAGVDRTSRAIRGRA